jgi:predicted nucleic acid-binding protein
VIVLDASAAVELVLRTPTGARVAARLRGLGETLHAPHLLDVEVASVLRRQEMLRLISTRDAEQAFADLDLLGVTRYPHEPFLGRIWELRRNVTAYGACYVALAEALGAPLLTCDARLAASSGHRALIHVA